MKPLLIWPGKKTWLVPYVKPLWEKYKDTHTMVEPFGGSLAMSFGLEVEDAVANDTFPGWCSFYQYLRCGMLPYNGNETSLENTKEAYLAARGWFNNEIATNGPHRESSDIQFGSVFYFLNRTCFSGNMRVTSKGLVNSPYGYRRGAFNWDAIATGKHQKLIANWKIIGADAEAVIRKMPLGFQSLNRSCFLFADPPYHEGTEAYSRDAASYDKQIAWSHALADQKCPVIACNAPTEFIKELYRTQGFTLFLGARTGAGFKHDKRKQELIMLKNFSEEEMSLFRLERISK